MAQAIPGPLSVDPPQPPQVVGELLAAVNAV